MSKGKHEGRIKKIISFTIIPKEQNPFKYTEEENSHYCALKAKSIAEETRRGTLTGDTFQTHRQAMPLLNVGTGNMAQ